MDQRTTFKALHQNTSPLFIANCWDPLSALIIEQAGGKAVATTSWGMSNHQGYKDGEQLTFDHVLQTVSAILKMITIPLSVDIEAGYSADQNQIIKHIIQLADLGVAGINIEDKPSHQSSLRDIASHQALLQAIKQALHHRGFKHFFINARCDLCLQPHWTEATLHERALAYQTAGCDGFFIPGLTDTAMIKRLTALLSIPVNVMLLPGFSDKQVLAELGVKRISSGNALSDHVIAQQESATKKLLEEHTVEFLFEQPVLTTRLSS
ncbi:isocitrate lyase/PEP mutase family protein [Pseudoalteromonas galatheae]|uniref:isocitrate lyase/PEP mutase family protein n=1 Tax=Pseudoalteromonas galatheae TaxID=579562 RepID=UPI00110831E6|nr:isocitrate lyase/phosphoenolpyruvate mutase family protein [Pseudoalteromonas galatheae]NKC20430.1 isocitrate lyase/phosphoenolpyruvate mutase family protein [Pseudoalteromonas galatheae]